MLAEIQIRSSQKAEVQKKPQPNKSQTAKGTGQQPKPLQQNRQEPQNRNSSSQNRGTHRNYGKSKNNRFDDKKINAIETVDDISADILRIEKEIELEIKEITAMTLGV